MNVCTIIAKNYLAHARVLARSFAEHHPDGRFWTLVIDDFAHYIDPAQEPFEILTPQAVGCEQFTQMAFSYSVLELSTAVKPWLLRYLLRETGGPVTYLDPDIKIFSSLDRVHELAAERGLVLTPHNNQPVPQDGRRPSQIDIMIAGVYNLGYVTLAPRPEIESLLDWWADRLLRDCRVDPVWGYFVDQRWFDLAPGLVSELAILRDPEFNVAYWNLHSRRLELREGQYTVDGRPLAFFHFSGFDPEHPLVLSRHQDRIDTLAHPALEAVLAEYAADVLSEGHAVSRRWPYGYGALGDGTAVDGMLRELYNTFRDEQEGLGREAPSPFELEGARIFVRWIQEQSPGAAVGVSRALAHVYRKREDLQRAYPDLSGAGGVALITWAEEIGRHEVPVLARVWTSANGSDPTPAGAVGRGQSALPQPAEPAHPLRDGPWGANVIGQFSSELECGQAARAVLTALDAQGITALPIESHTTVGARHEVPYSTGSLEDAAFPVNLLCLGPDALLDFVRNVGREAFSGRYSIGLWSSEIGMPRDRVRQVASLLEEVWAPSSFVAAALAPVAALPVTTVPIAVDLPAFELKSRAELGLPGDRFLFLFSFDYSDGVERKNPLGVIKAFRSLSESGGEAQLVLRCRGSERFQAAHARLLEAALGGDIAVIDGQMSAAEEHSLIAQCDSYVSLHRAESFGPALAEAMWQGKPVIATGYSGNLDFMTMENSLLVGHRLIPVEPSADPDPSLAEWAEPDLAEATQRMHELLDDPDTARHLGAKAAADIRRTHSPAAAGQIMGRRLDAIRTTGRARIAPDEISGTPPALLSLPIRIQDALRRRANPGRARQVRELARRGVLTAARPVTRSQQQINDAFMAALMDLNRAIVELRREDAGKRASLLSQLRHYERILPLAESRSSRIDEIKRLLTLETDREVYFPLSELGRRHRAITAEPGEVGDTVALTGFELRAFSQNGEDGVLAEILRRTGAPTRYFVEFGVESGREGNCVYLADVAGWRGLFIEADDRFFDQLRRKYSAQDDVATLHAAVTPANVEQLFAVAGAPPDLDVLSIDVDGQDYWIWQAVEGYRPRVVVIEYNSALGLKQQLVQPDRPDGEWDGSSYYGASLGALERLAESKGYRLVHTELSAVNAFFVRADLVGEAFCAPVAVARRGSPNYYQRGIHHPAARADARYLEVDSGRLVGGGDAT